MRWLELLKDWWRSTVRAGLVEAGREAVELAKADLMEEITGKRPSPPLLVDESRGDGAAKGRTRTRV